MPTSHQSGNGSLRSPPSSPLNAEVEVLELIARQVGKVPWPVGLSALFVLAMAWHQVPQWALLAWTIAVIGMQAVRWTMLRGLPGSARSHANRMQIAVLLSGFNGLVQGSAVLFFYGMTDLQRAVVSILLAGITAGAVGTTNGHPRIFKAFALPVMLGLSLAWAVTPHQDGSLLVDGAMSFLCLAFLAVQNGLARDNYRALVESVEMRNEQIRLNEQLRTALEQAEEANAAKTRFLASASHDLRQPLHTLTLFCAALMTHEIDPSARRILTHMDAALSALRSQLTALLDMSKLDAGIVTVQARACNVAPMLQRLCDAKREEAHTKGLRLTCAIEDTVVVHTDPLHLERIVGNLLDNAIKYCDAGHVWLQARRVGHEVHLIVKDTGRGIAEKDLGKVFEEFYQVDNPERDRTRGLGLGLSIVQRLSRLLAMPLSLDSELGVGTTVSLTLPQAEASDAPPVEEVVESAAIPLCHMLVLDDEAGVRVAMKTLLESLGCRVTLAACTDEAMRLASLDPPDVVLADFRLRGEESGIKAIRKLRQQQPDLPAMLISGDTAQDRLLEAQQAGLRMLHKPVSVDVLLKAVMDTLELGVLDAPVESSDERVASGT
jgi:signal transduction histidine kinase/CheY-like chemotaxis protein